VAGGSATLNNSSITYNTAQSTVQVSIPGTAAGGGLYAARGTTVTLSGDSVEYNTASAYGTTSGGGIYNSQAKAYLDSYTVTHTTNDTAAIDPDIDGTYILT
jgi:hypothetical protein